MRDPIFKGATRPAMVFGVPLVAFVPLGALHVVGGMWLMTFVGPFWLFVSLSAFVVEALGLRELSRDDAYRIAQTLKFWAWWAYRRNTKTWGAHSMSPINFKKR